jgi:hypothetical protein
MAIGVPAGMRSYRLCYRSRPVGDLFDLAVIAVAVLVCISLVLLAWTLGVSITNAMRRGHASVIDTRLELATMERRLRHAMRATTETDGRTDEGDE